jgi:pimeloyl-ACP methyl ester carboxylesterase
MSTDYGRIRLPVTVIVGDSDQVLVPEEQSIRLAAQIADAEIIFLTGCGHQVQYAFPGTVAEAIRRHLGGSR